MRPYRPSGAMPGGSLWLLLIVALVSGLVLGGIMWAIDKYASFYLVFVFPLAGGAIAGGILALVIKSTKMQNPTMAVVVGLMAGVVMYGAYHGAFYYITFRNDYIRSEYSASYPGKTPTEAQLDDFMNEGLMYRVQDTGFVGYLKYTASNGFSITSTTGSSSSSDLEIKDTGAFIYWGVEILLASIVAAVIARNAAKEPFDEATNTWFDSRHQVVALAPNKSRKALLRALQEGQFQEAGAMLTQQQIKYPRIEVWTRRSSNPAAPDVMLLLKIVQRNKRANNLKSGMVSVSELDTILKAVDTEAMSNPVVSNL
ncbi:MAG: hypothetical protein H6672_12690 [Anaerolineaceae bacterium]|nr:hypothetical protein [Anaerolineaceae bacterium]